MEGKVGMDAGKEGWSQGGMEGEMYGWRDGGRGGWRGCSMREVEVEGW